MNAASAVVFVHFIPQHSFTLFPNVGCDGWKHASPLETRALSIPCFVTIRTLENLVFANAKCVEASQNTMSGSTSDLATSRDELRDTYTRRFSGQEQRRRQIWEILNRHFFDKWIKPEDSVLDLGAGYCEFINSVHAQRKFALDLNPNTALQASSDVQVISQDITRRWALDNASVDVVFTSNFLEHLPAKKDLTHCLQEASRILRPGGLFIALGPNIRFAFREYWDFFDHYLPLSDRSLVGLSLADQNGRQHPAPLARRERAERVVVRREHHAAPARLELERRIAVRALLGDGRIVSREHHRGLGSGDLVVGMRPRYNAG